MPATTTRRTLAEGGSNFRFEAEMAVPVLRWLQRRGLAVKLEFSLPWGVCDLVGVKLDAEKAKRRLAHGQARPIGSFLRVWILSKIPNSETRRSISVTKLTKDLCPHIPGDVLLKELDGLARDKFITTPRIGHLQRLDGWAPLHVRVVAVELKLSRISEAISQAISNYTFATDSYVALPRERALHLSHTERADVLTRNGVGLLAVTRNACREIIRPRASSAVRNELIQTHVVERFWRTRDS